MVFDATQDEVLCIRTEEIGDVHMEVKLVSRNQGEPKIQISRFVIEEPSRAVKYRRLGRMTLDEAKWVKGVVGELLMFHQAGESRGNGEEEKATPEAE
ncbi:hypothetical protein LCGC14_0399670 [marine sediment metagenome]|uniref:Transcriptional coactivator p15 (PC4) C-terminal domain-containing protein n=1 Tax=marine sediment metagenome TaxID=412755 RepID=A0A0F9SX78_9ZZZZ